MKLALLCNNQVMFPALQELCRQGVNICVGSDRANKEFAALLEQFCAAVGCKLNFFDRDDFERQLHKWLDEVKPDAVLMMTCPFRIPVSALWRPRHGFINFHYGLLPQYRGANPVFEEIRRRENFGGITVHQVDEKIDTGDIIKQQRIPLHSDETFGMHMNRLATLGAEMVNSLLPLLASDNPIPATPQNHQVARYYKRPDINDVTVQWSTMQSSDIVALANACNPWNFGAATNLNGNIIGINAAVVTDDLSASVALHMKPGTILTISQHTGLRVATTDSKVVRLDILYVDNGFMPGYKLALLGIAPGMCFN